MRNNGSGIIRRKYVQEKESPKGKPKPIWKIAVGLFLAIANARGPSGTFPGFYYPDSAELLGHDIAKLAIYGLCAWLIYRGIKPKA